MDGKMLSCCFIGRLSDRGYRFVIAAEIINTTTAGVAVDGFDMVAYFELGYPVKGHTDHRATYKGARWLFATSGHRSAFVADPVRH